MSGKRKPLTPEQKARNNEHERARYHAAQAAKGLTVRTLLPKPVATPKKPKPVAKTASARGPAGTSAEPDMSKAKWTRPPTPPCRYAVLPSEFVGMFSALGPGRYLSDSQPKG